MKQILILIALYAMSILGAFQARADLRTVFPEASSQSDVTFVTIGGPMLKLAAGSNFVVANDVNITGILNHLSRLEVVVSEKKDVSEKLSAQMASYLKANTQYETFLQSTQNNEKESTNVAIYAMPMAGKQHVYSEILLIVEESSGENVFLSLQGKITDADLALLSDSL